MVTYFDLRNAAAALAGLQGRPIKDRYIDLHYSIPKENASGNDLQQGTIVIYTLGNEHEIRDALSGFGDIREIKDTAVQRRNQKIVEFYDTRDAENALKQSNRIAIRGKKVKIEALTVRNYRRLIGSGSHTRTHARTAYTRVRTY